MTLEMSFVLLESSIVLKRIFIVKASLMTIITYDCHNFIVQAGLGTQDGYIGLGVNMQQMLCNVGRGV